MNPLNQAIFAPYRDSIVVSQRPTVNITLQPSASLSVWQSKVGGVPYLPRDAAYPHNQAGEPLAFLAQINFADMPPLPHFPTQGILQFYIDANDDLWGLDFDNPTAQNGFRVVYFADLITDPQQLHAAQERYGREYIAPHIRQNALDLLAQHRAAGDTMVLTTATICYIARPIGQQLGFADDNIITTQLHYSSDGRITGDTVGQFNLREGKVHNFERWLQARGWGWGDIHLTFYSDSINDLPLLEKANVAIATNPDNTLRPLAAERGWHIMDLFQKL